MEELYVAITHLCRRAVYLLASALRALRGLPAADAWVWLVRAAAPGGLAAKITKAGAFAAEPAGLFGWVDTGVDTDVLAQRLLDDGYMIAPGALFHAGRQPSTLMRINFATTQDAAFWRVYRQRVSEL